MDVKIKLHSTVRCTKSKFLSLLATILTSGRQEKINAEKVNSEKVNAEKVGSEVVI